MSYIGEWSGGSPFEVSDEEVRERLLAMGRVPETDEEYLSGCVRFGKGTHKDTHLRNRNGDTWHALDASLEAFG